MYGRRFGLERETALRIAAGFASGMRMAATCGAVTGAIMVLGLRHAAADCHVIEGRRPVYAAVVELRRQIEARHGTVICRDLLGCDPCTPEGMQVARDRNLFKTVCPQVVRDTAEVLDRMLS